MPYTVQIDYLDAAVGLDGVTPIDFSDPGVSVVQADDKFTVTINPGIAFGLFDPGELVNLPNVPYLMLSASIAAPVMPFAAPPAGGSIALLGPVPDGVVVANRKVLTLLAPLAEGLILPQPGGFNGSGQLIPFDHCLAFRTDPIIDPGPYRIVLTFEPFRDSRQPNGEDLPSAWAAGSLA